MAYSKKQLQDIIEEAANRHGVDAEQLKIIAGIESSYNPNAVGAETRSGRALGLFQFTPATAKGYGVKNPKDPVQAADGAARYWKDLSRQFDGQLPLMIAQYNGGNSGARAAKNGRVFEETRGYYDKFNKEAKAQGLSSFIPVNNYEVIPKKGSKKKYPKVVEQGEPQGTVGEVYQPQNNPNPQASFVDNQQDIRNEKRLNTDELGTAEGMQDYEDENRTYLEAAKNFVGSAVEGAYVSNYAAQGLNFIRQDINQEKQGSEGWEEEATDDYIIDRLESSKIPRENWDFVLQGLDSRDAFNLRLKMAEDANAARDTLAKSTGGMVLGALGGGALDPTFWLSGGMGALAAAGKATRTAKMASGIAAGAATDAALGEAIGGSVDVNYEDIDLAINAAGGAFGGLIGSFAKGNLSAKLENVDEGTVEVPEGFTPPTGEPPTPEPPITPEAPKAPPAPPEEPIEVFLPEKPIEGADEPPVPPEVPTEAPRSEPWDATWDTPERVSAFTRGEQVGDTLAIPPHLNFEDSLRYIATYGSEHEKRMVELLSKASEDLVITKLTPNSRGKAIMSEKPTDLSESLYKHYQDDVAESLKKVDYKAAAAWAYPARHRVGTNGTFDAVQYYKVYNYKEIGRKGITAETLIHESLHSVTTHWMNKVSSLKRATRPLSKTDAELVKAYDELNAVFNKLRNTSRRLRMKQEAPLEAKSVGFHTNTAYGFSNLKEFVAEMASLPFAKALGLLEKTVAELPERTARGLEVSDLRSTLKKALDATAKFLKKVFGNDKDASLYVDGYRSTVLNFMDKVIEARKADAEELRKMRESSKNVQEGAALPKELEPDINSPDPVAPDMKPSLMKQALDNAVEYEGKGIDDYVKENIGGVTFDKIHGAFSIEAIFQNPRMPPAIRALGNKLVGSTTGYRNGEVVARNVWDDTVALRDSQKAKYLKGHHLVFEQYWKAQAGSGFKARVSIFEKEKARVVFNDAVTRSIHSGVESPDPFIKQAVEFNQKFLAEWVDRINNPLGDEGGTMKGLTEVIVEKVDPDTGEVTRTVTGTLQKNPNYSPFSLNVSKLNEVFRRFGSKAVHDFMETAFYRANPHLKEVAEAGGKQYGKMFAKWYFKQVLDSKVNRKFDYMHSLETSASGDDIVQSMVDAGIDTTTAQEMVDALLRKSEGTKAYNSSLRHRSTFDRTYEQVMPDGSVLSMYDLIDTDIGRVMDGYIGRMSGAVSLAKHFDGASSLSDITRLFQKAKERTFGEKQLSDAQVNEVTGAFESAMAHILGRQVDDKTSMKLVLSTIRNLNVARLLGASVLYQVMEAAQLVGTIGIRNTLRAMPELAGNIRRDIKTGKLNMDMLNDFEDLISGSGIDMLRYVDIQRGDEYQAFHGSNRWTKAADNVDFTMRKAAASVLKFTGMTGIMTIEKRLALIAITRHFQDVAVDGKKLAYNAKRLATAGVSPKALDEMLEAMRKYSSKTERGRHKLDTARWNEQDPDTFATFKVFLQRESRRTIQENDLGSHIPQMDNGWMKSFGQFRTFVLHAHSKALLYGVNHADAQTAATLLYAIGSGILMQYARAMMKAAPMSEEERKEYLAKALNFTGAGGVFARGIASISQAALLPQLIDTLSFGGNIFDGYRSTTDTSSLWANPTADLVSAGVGAVKQLGYMATGQDSMDRRDAKAMLKLLPANNALGVAQVLGIMTNALPKNTKAELLFAEDEE